MTHGCVGTWGQGPQPCRGRSGPGVLEGLQQFPDREFGHRRVPLMSQVHARPVAFNRIKLTSPRPGALVPPSTHIAAFRVTSIGADQVGRGDWKTFYIKGVGGCQRLTSPVGAGCPQKCPWVLT